MQSITLYLHSSSVSSTLRMDSHRRHTSKTSQRQPTQSTKPYSTSFTKDWAYQRRFTTNTRRSCFLCKLVRAARMELRDGAHCRVRARNTRTSSMSTHSRHTSITTKLTISECHWPHSQSTIPPVIDATFSSVIQVPTISPSLSLVSLSSLAACSSKSSSECSQMPTMRKLTLHRV